MGNELSCATRRDGPAVRLEAAERAPRAPCVLLTGQPSAGKSTLARRLQRLLQASGRPAEVLDGDELRRRLPPALGFGADDRHAQFARALFIAELLAGHRVVPVLALVAPYRADRRRAASVFAAAGFLEVYLDPPLHVCRQRDSRGVYGRLGSARSARMTSLYEPPDAADLTLDTSALDVRECAERTLEALLAAWR